MRAALVFAAVASIVACRRAPPPPTASADPVVPDSSASSVKLAKTPPFAAALEQRLDGIYLVVASESIAERVAETKLVEACVVEPAPDDRYGDPAPKPETLNLVCPGGSLPIAIHDEAIAFGAKRIKLPRRATLKPGVVPRDFASPCALGSKGPSIAVEPRAIAAASLLDVTLHLPELSVVLPLVPNATRVRSVHRKAANTLHLIINQGMSARHSLAIVREGELLRIRGSFRVIGGGTGSHTKAAYWLPCGATLNIKKVNRTTPSFFWIDENCPGCNDADQRCQDRCEEDLTDENGELTQDGHDCTSKCTAAFSACESKCPKK